MVHNLINNMDNKSYTCQYCNKKMQEVVLFTSVKYICEYHEMVTFEWDDTIKQWKIVGE